jgi:ribosomal protein S18 acetylase RimI-like enzyme
MYVKPEFRGEGIGRKMSEILIDTAKKAGYKYMRLDTIDTMITARELYRSLGFKIIPPYRYNPIEGTVYMELEL